MDGDILSVQSERSIDFILDLPLEITVELGGATMKIRELLEINEGAVMVLSERDEEPVNIYIKDKLIARGDIIVQNGKYGIQITEVKSRIERINSLA